MDFPVANTAGSHPSLKSFWERPEGTTGMVTLALGALGLTAFLYAVGPFILTALTTGVAIMGQAIMLGILCGIAALLLFIVTNKRVQLAASMWFKISMRKVTSFIVATYPIEIMKEYINSMVEKKEAFTEKKTLLSGQIRVFEQTMEKNAQEAAKALKMVEAAKKAGDAREVTFNSREYGRLTEANKNFEVTLNKMKMLYSFLKKYDEACDFVIRDLRGEVRIREQEQAMSRAGHSAIMSAMAILKGSGAEKEMYDEAVEFVVNEFAQKMGEIDDFMSSTESIISGINLQNGMWEAEAEKQLQAFESKSDSIVLGGTKRLMLENVSSPTVSYGNFTVADPLPIKHGSGDNDYMSKFLEK